MSGNQGFMRIGEVHAQLRKLFPEVELSKIRYYEDKGLVQPSRSRKGYRLYSDRDIDCLREAIRLAQEEFVPLRVVRLRLIEQGLLVASNASATTRQIAREAASSSVSVPAPSPAPNDRPVLSVVADANAGASESASAKNFFTTVELLDTTGLEAHEFNQMRATGLVAPVILDGETMYSALDLRVAVQARALLSRGVDARLLGSLRRVAEREVGVVDDLTWPLRQGGNELSREEILAITADVAREVASLRDVLVERELLVYLRD